MPTDDPVPLEAFVPALAWPGRRPSLAELATWHEALRDAVGQLMPLDLLACWLLPSRGGSLLLGPGGMAGEGLTIPAAEPLVTQEGLFRLEDRIRAGGYQSVMAVPIRAEVQDVGILAVARFAGDEYRLADLRTLHRVAALIATPCRRLAAQPWITPAVPSEERPAMVAAVTDAVLTATERARSGADLVLLVSDAIGAQVPHDRLELVAVAPAPDCWALLGTEGLPAATGVQLTSGDLDRVDALVHHLGSRETMRIDDLQATELQWPGPHDRRGAERQRSLCAARLSVGGEMVGWLWVGSDSPSWFSAGDEEAIRLTARLLSGGVAAWTARHELAGAWS
jgi:GAF domain-containing protein